MKFLIVTADDFGLSTAVNEAVEQASREGVLTAASLMVSGPAAADAIRRARQLPRLRVGLHVVLADGAATLAPHRIPELVNVQGRMDAGMVAKSIRFFAVPTARSQLEAEIRAQFDAFARTGLILDHVNAHKHFHLHPSILSALLRVGREFGVAAIRVPDEPVWFSSRCGGRSAGAGTLLLKPWNAFMRRRLRCAGIAYNDRVFGVAASGSMDEGRFLTVLRRLPAGVSELYLHPAVGGAELAALLSARVGSELQATGCGRGGYRDAFATHRRLFS